MEGFSEYLADAVLDHVFGVTPYTAPDIYIAAFNGDPSGAGSELSGDNYSRVQHASWTASVSRVLSNSAAITLPTASGNWAEFSYVALYDAASGGNRLASGPLDSPINVETGQFVVFPVGDLEIELSDGN